MSNRYTFTSDNDLLKTSHTDIRTGDLSNNYSCIPPVNFNNLLPDASFSKTKNHNSLEDYNYNSHRQLLDQKLKSQDYFLDIDSKLEIANSQAEENCQLKQKILKLIEEDMILEQKIAAFQNTTGNGTAKSQNSQSVSNSMVSSHSISMSASNSSPLQLVSGQVVYQPSPAVNLVSVTQPQKKRQKLQTTGSESSQNLSLQQQSQMLINNVNTINKNSPSSMYRSPL